MIRLQSIKQKIRENGLEYLLYFFIFLLPWQTRWIFHNYLVVGEVFEYGRMSLYGFDIILIILLLFYFIKKIKNQKSKTESNIFLISSLFTIYCLLSFFWSNEKLVALYWGIRMLLGLGLFYLIQQINFSKIKLAVIVAMAGVLQGFLGIWQFLSQHVWSAKWLGMAGQSAQNLGASVVEFGIERWLRAYGSLPHPNIYGAFLILSLLAVIYLISKIQYEYHKIWLLFGISFIWLGILFSFSRASWLLAGIILIAGFIYVLKQTEPRIKIFVVYLWIYILILLSGFIFLNGALIKTRLHIGTPVRLEVMSNIARLNGYEQAGKLIQHNWLIGTGIGNYTFALQDNFKSVIINKYNVWNIQAIHNVYVLILAELGILGLLIISFLNGYFVVLLIKWREWSYLSMLLVVYSLLMFDHFWWTTASGVYILWIIMGLGAKKIVNNIKY